MRARSRCRALTPPAKSRVLLVDRPGSVQTSLWLGGLGIERRSDDYFAVLVMNHILGGGPASRLFINLREDKGYTYGVYSFFNGSRFPGVMVASTDVRTAVTEGAMHELMAELRRIGSEPVPEQELKNAKRALIGRFALSLDSPQTLIGNLATQKIYGLPADYWDTYPQRVEAITAADMQRVAKKYYDASRLQIVAVGDGASVHKVLEKYGTVETAAPCSRWRSLRRTRRRTHELRYPADACCNAGYGGSRASRDMRPARPSPASPTSSARSRRT